MPGYRIPSKAQIEQQARSVQRQMESRVRNKTNNGRKALTKQEIQQLAREAARKMQF